MQHAKLSPSKAKRWLNCPAAALAYKLGAFPSAAMNIYGYSGTLKHRIVERALKEVQEVLRAWYMPDKINLKRFMDALGRELVCPDSPYPSVKSVRLDTSEILCIYNACVQHIFGRTFRTEYKIPVRLANLATFGTADVVTLRPDTDVSDAYVLGIVDWKFGYQPINPRTDPQTRLYALGAVCKLRDRGVNISNAEYTIVQPASDPQITTVKVTVDQLLEMQTLQIRYSREEIPGDWCLYCEGLDACKAYALTAAEDNHKLVKDMPGGLLW